MAIVEFTVKKEIEKRLLGIYLYWRKRGVTWAFVLKLYKMQAIIMPSFTRSPFFLSIIIYCKQFKNSVCITPVII